MSDFAATISEAYATQGSAIDLGRGVHDGKLENDAVVRVPLRMMNRHTAADRRRRPRRVPDLSRGQGASEEGHARGVRHAA